MARVLTRALASGAPLGVNTPLLVVLSYYIGFRDSFSWQENVVDAFVSVAVGFTMSGAALLLFSVLEWGMSAGEIIGKVALQAVPGSLGAILAAGQLGLKTQDKKSAAAATWPNSSLC